MAQNMYSEFGCSGSIQLEEWPDRIPVLYSMFKETVRIMHITSVNKQSSVENDETWKVRPGKVP